jgi:hypothetical protein
MIFLLKTVSIFWDIWLEFSSSSDLAPQRCNHITAGNRTRASIGGEHSKARHKSNYWNLNYILITFRLSPNSRLYELLAWPVLWAVVLIIISTQAWLDNEGECANYLISWTPLRSLSAFDRNREDDLRVGCK